MSSEFPDHISYRVFILWAHFICTLCCLPFALVGIFLALAHAQGVGEYLYYLSWALLLLIWLQYERERL